MSTQSRAPGGGVVLPLDVSVDESHVPPAVITVRAPFRASASQVWHALTDSHAASQWLGTLASPLEVGEMTTLTLPDGEFFLLQPALAEPPVVLRYVWAALGMGVEDTVTWRLEPTEEGCLVTVTDTEPERTDAQARRDEARCLDFLARLDGFLSGRSLGSVGCRDEFDVSIELTATPEGVWGLLTEPTAHGRWLPLVGPSLQAGATFTIADGQKPAVFHAADVHVDHVERRVTFRLGHPNWLHPATCVLEALPRRSGAMLTVRHDGWRGISLDPDEQRRQRARWSKAWSGALRRFTLLYVRGRDLPSMSPAELHSRLGEPGLFVFDTNVRSKWARGHLAGATHVGPEPFAPDVLPPDKASTLVFYCLSTL